MTPRYGYALATGWDATSLTNIESLVTNAPVGKLVPLGSTRRTTLDQHVQTNGTKIITWSCGAMSKADFQLLIATIWGGFDTEDANVTIDTRQRDENYSRYNAVAIAPQEGVDYQRREYGDVEGLVITFRDLQELTGGSAFSLGFSIGHKA
jgi:hypothetical protein